MILNGGGAARSGKREFYTALALLVMVFMAAGALFAAPAWAQSEGLDDNRVRDTDTDNNTNDGANTNNQKDTGPDNIDLIEILNAENCDVDPGAVIVFEDEDGSLFLVADGINARISERGDVIRVVDDGDDEDPNTPDVDIEFLEDTGEFVELPVSTDLSVQSVGGIQCGGERQNRSTRPVVPEPFPLDAFPPGTVNPETGEITVEEFEGDEDSEEDGETSTQQEQLEDAENDLGDEDTTGEDTIDSAGEDTFGDEEDPGARASSGGDNEASTPGAVASSGGDPDEQAPVGQQQAEEQGGDVVDEIPTEGPLPETGGASVAAGTSLALVLFGVSLLALRLVSARRGRRT